VHNESFWLLALFLKFQKIRTAVAAERVEKRASTDSTTRAVVMFGSGTQGYQAISDKKNDDGTKDDSLSATVTINDSNSSSKLEARSSSPSFHDLHDDKENPEFALEALLALLGLAFPLKHWRIFLSCWCVLIRITYIVLIVANGTVLVMQFAPLVPRIFSTLAHSFGFINSSSTTDSGSSSSGGGSSSNNAPISLDNLSYDLAVSLQVWGSFLLMWVLMSDLRGRKDLHKQESSLAGIFGEGYANNMHFKKTARAMWRFYIPVNVVLVAFILGFTLNSSSHSKVIMTSSSSTDVVAVGEVTEQHHPKFKFFFALLFSTLVQTTVFFFVASDLYRCDHVTGMLYKKADRKQLRFYFLALVKKVVDDASKEYSSLLFLVVLIAMVNGFGMIFYFFFTVPVSSSSTQRQLLALFKTACFLGREFVLLGATLYSISHINANSRRLATSLSDSVWDCRPMLISEEEKEEEENLYRSVRAKQQKEKEEWKHPLLHCVYLYCCCSCGCCSCCCNLNVDFHSFHRHADIDDDVEEKVDVLRKSVQDLHVSEEVKRDRLLRFVVKSPILFTIYGIKIDNTFIYAQAWVFLTPLLYWGTKASISFLTFYVSWVEKMTH